MKENQEENQEEKMECDDDVTDQQGPEGNFCLDDLENDQNKDHHQEDKEENDIPEIEEEKNNIASQKNTDFLKKKTITIVTIETYDTIIKKKTKIVKRLNKPTITRIYKTIIQK